MLTLVTGATGFIGSRLVASLIQSGHQVRSLARETSDCSAIQLEGVEVRKGSLVDIEFMKEACRGVDIVFNLAGRMGGHKSSLQEMKLVNIEAVKTLLAACRGRENLQFIHCSTPGVLGMSGVAPEALPYRPCGPYERTKCDGEKAVLSCHKRGEINATVIRPDFVYGPGDTHKLKMFRAIRDGRFPLITGGRSLLHPTYVDDVVRGFLLVMNNPAAYGETFNIAGPKPVSVGCLVRAICAEFGAETTQIRIPIFALKMAAACAEAAAALTRREPLLTRYQVDFFTRSHASDISKARKILGYEPRIDLTEGIHKTVAWYRQKGYIQ